MQEWPWLELSNHMFWIQDEPAIVNFLSTLRYYYYPCSKAHLAEHGYRLHIYSSIGLISCSRDYGDYDIIQDGPVLLKYNAQPGICIKCPPSNLLFPAVKTFL